MAGVGILGEQGRMRPFARGTSDRDDQDVEPDLKPRRFGAPLIGAVAGRRVSTSRGALKGSSGPYLYPSALWAHTKPRPQHGPYHLSTRAGASGNVCFITA